MMGNYLSLWAPEVPSWVAFKSTGHSRGDGEVPHDTMQPSIAPSEAEEADGPRVQRLNTAQWAHRDAFTLASGQDAIVVRRTFPRATTLSLPSSAESVI